MLHGEDAGGSPLLPPPPRATEGTGGRWGTEEPWEPGDSPMGRGGAGRAGGSPRQGEPSGRQAGAQLWRRVQETFPGRIRLERLFWSTFGEGNVGLSPPEEGVSAEQGSLSGWFALDLPDSREPSPPWLDFPFIHPK